MSRATPWAPKPNAIAAAKATAPRMIRNVGAASGPRSRASEGSEPTDYDGDYSATVAEEDVAARGASDDPGQEVARSAAKIRIKTAAMTLGRSNKLAENINLPYAKSVRCHNDGVMMNTNQKISLPSMLVGVCLVSALSKNCLMPPLSISSLKLSPEYPCNHGLK